MKYLLLVVSHSISHEGESSNDFINFPIDIAKYIEVVREDPLPDFQPNLDFLDEAFAPRRYDYHPTFLLPISLV
jgi:hypothetical protein